MAQKEVVGLNCMGLVLQSDHSSYVLMKLCFPTFCGCRVGSEKDRADYAGCPREMKMLRDDHSKDLGTPVCVQVAALSSVSSNHIIIGARVKQYVIMSSTVGMMSCPSAAEAWQNRWAVYLRQTQLAGAP